jgi:hemolysin activation/secretion protein
VLCGVPLQKVSATPIELQSRLQNDVRLANQDSLTTLQPDRFPAAGAVPVLAPTPPELMQPDFAAPELLTQVPTPTSPVPDPSQQVPDPNRDRLIQPAPAPIPTTPEQTQPIIPTPAAPDQPTPDQPTPDQPTPDQPAPDQPAPDQPAVQIPVSKIEVTGSTILKPADLEPITKPLEGRSATLEQLRQVADAITQLYLDRGYITSRAILVDQTITDGVVRIRVVEGSLERVELEGNQRVRDSYIRSRIELAASPPLSRDRLEDQLRLLKLDPLFTNVEASLRPGTQLGQSVLVVRVSEAPSLSGIIGVDNFSPPSVGAVRLGGGLSYRNLTGFGDEVAFSYFRTTAGGANTFDLTYRIPVNAMNGTVQFRFAPNNNRIIDPDFEVFDIRGESQLYELSFRQPLIRTPREEFALSVGFAAQNGQTFLFEDLGFPFGIGPDEDGNSRTRVFKFGQDFVKRDPQGAWALRSQFNFGVDIFDATVNESPIPDGRFFSWLGQIQRVQRLGNNHLLIVQGDLQLTPDSLLPSQQFVIGGGQSLRGFRQNSRSGDNGFRFSIEDRIAVLRDEAGVPTIQFSPFIDFGKVWNKSDNPNRTPDQTFLAGIGLGLLWQVFPRFNLRADYALPLVDLDDRGNDAQDKAFYFNVNYQF